MVWLKRSSITLSYQGSTARVNIKEQSKTMQSVIRRAMALGELYLVLGIPCNDVLTLDSAATMQTPFSTAGLHSLAITALVAAAEEHEYSHEGDVVDRLTMGSEKSYIKPLRTHVRVCFLSCLCINQCHL